MFKLNKFFEIEDLMRLLVCLLISLLFFDIVSAFGASALYRDGKPLYMEKGESEEIYFLLQNMVGNEDIKLKAEIVEGSEIAKFIDESEIYDVPFGRKDIKANMIIEIPANAEDGIYRIGVLFKQITEGGGEMLQITGGVVNSFDVVVGDVRESPGIGRIFLVIIIVLISVIILMIFLFILIKLRNNRIRGNYFL